MSSPEAAPHPEATAMLFYVRGTLDPDEARALERHLAECAACREERARCEQLGSSVYDAVAGLPSPPPDLFARVRSRIAASEAPVHSLAAPLRPQRDRPRMALAAAVVLALQAGLIAGVAALAYRSGQREAVTLSGPTAMSPGSEGAHRLRVAFDDAATASSIRALLESLDARIVDGPSAAGFYVLEVPKSRDANTAWARIRSSPLVRFAERVE
jgi:anti-sigma factor RsiW